MLLTLLFTFALDPLIVAILALDSPLRRQPSNEIASKIEQNLAKHLAQAFKGLVLDGGPPEGPVTANHSQQFGAGGVRVRAGLLGRIVWPCLPFHLALLCGRFLECVCCCSAVSFRRPRMRLRNSHFCNALCGLFFGLVYLPV